MIMYEVRALSMTLRSDEARVRNERDEKKKTVNKMHRRIKLRMQNG